VGLLAKGMGLSGCSVWQLSLLRSLDLLRFVWLGCAVASNAKGRQPEIVAANEQYLPVSWDSDADLALARECDVLISWGVPLRPDRLKEANPRIQIVAFDYVTWASIAEPDLAARSASIDAWVQPSELTLDDVPVPHRHKAMVIWNPVDESRLAVERSREEMHRQWGVPPGSKVAGFFNRLSPEKDPEAMVRLARSLPSPWHVVVVGEGPEMPSLSEAKANEGLDRLHLPGADLAAGDVLGAFDVLVVPSLHETFGITIAEGLWMDLPVVSTEVGLARMRPGLTTVIPFDADGMTLAMAVMGATPNLVAKAFVRERCSRERFGREWAAVIEAIVPAKTAPPVAPTPAKSPGLLSQAASLGRAIVAHIADGGRLASDEVQAERRRICESNACKLYDAANDKCTACGCSNNSTANWIGVSLDLKRSWASSACPARSSQWGAV
jgi:glycosyltransferase involved in cell wall biosynthesis